MATNISTIGSAGRNYPTIAAWATATKSSPDIEIGELYADSAFSGAVDFDDGGTTSSQYRWLRPAAGEEYDIVAGTGVAWSDPGNLAKIKEDYFRLTGPIGIFNTFISSTGSRHCVRVLNSATDVFVAGIYARFLGGVLAAGSTCFQVVSGSTASILSCIAQQTSSPLVAPSYGFDIQSSAASTRLHHCVSVGFFRSACFRSSVSSTNVVLRNCIATTPALGAVNYDVSGTDADYCISQDATAPGSNSFTGVTAGDVFEDAAFRPVYSSDAVNSGVDVSSAVPSGSAYSDFGGNLHNGNLHNDDGYGVEIGAWDLDTTFTGPTLNVGEAFTTLTLAGVSIDPGPGALTTGSGTTKLEVLIPGTTQASVLLPGTVRSEVLQPGAALSSVAIPGTRKVQVLTPGAAKVTVT